MKILIKLHNCTRHIDKITSLFVTITTTHPRVYIHNTVSGLTLSERGLMAEPVAKQASSVTQEDVKSAEENVKKLRKEGASKELVSHTQHTH